MSKEFDDQVQNAFKKNLLKFTQTYPEDVDVIIAATCLSAAKAELNAAYGGSMSNPGYTKLKELENFVSGVMYSNTSDRNYLPETYRRILFEVDRQKDPEYEAYLKLKEKFETK